MKSLQNIITTIIGALMQLYALAFIAASFMIPFIIIYIVYKALFG